MDIKQYFEYESECIPKEIVLQVDEQILDDLYASSDIFEKFNVYFHLQNNFFNLYNNGNYKEAAYICYLISYYLFVALTPSHSEDLAKEYAQKAIKMDSCPKYLEWLDEVKKGN